MLFNFEDLNLQTLEKKIRAEERLSFDDGVILWNSFDLLGVGYLANIVRERIHGNDTYFIHNRHINPTNVCVLSCQFCAFGVKADHPQAYEKSLEEIFSDAEKYNGGEVSEFHIVGGLHPDYPFEYYLDLLKGLKVRFPAVHIQAYTAVELEYLSRLAHLPLKETMEVLKESGLGSIPGGGAEIFAKRVRRKICGDKITGEEWLQVHEIAHSVGLKSNATMLYGHIEKPEHIVDHLIKIRELQKKTKGFVTLIPLKFSLDNTELEQDNLVNNECSSVYDLRITALSRLMLANTLNNISVYWVAYGKKLAQVALSNGGSDLVGTAFSEEIYRAAGKPTTSSVDELATMVKEVGRIPAQRNTHFDILKHF